MNLPVPTSRGNGAARGHGGRTPRRAAGHSILREGGASAARGSVLAQITLVGERQAVAGHEFVYRGAQPECRGCRVRSACLNQEVGKRYRVVQARDVSHPCLLNEERARVVEVEDAAPECSLPARGAVEGAIVGYVPLVCANAACPHFRLCHPVGIERGTRLRIVQMGQDLDCPLGYEIRNARVAYAE